MGRTARALFGANVRIVDWPCNRCPDLSLGLLAIGLGSCPVRKATCPAVTRRARLIFDHAKRGCAYGPLATIGFGIRIEARALGTGRLRRPILAGVCARVLPSKHRGHRFGLTAFGSRLGGSVR